MVQKMRKNYHVLFYYSYSYSYSYYSYYDDDDELASQSLVFGYVHPGTKLRGDGKTNARDHLVLNGTLAFVFRKRKRLQELAKDDSKSSHGDMLADA